MPCVALGMVEGGGNKVDAVGSMSLYSKLWSCVYYIEKYSRMRYRGEWKAIDPALRIG